MQARAVAALKPPLGVTLSVVEAVLPGETEADVDDSDRAKLGVTPAVMVTAMAGVDAEAPKLPETPA